MSIYGFSETCNLHRPHMSYMALLPSSTPHKQTAGSVEVHREWFRTRDVSHGTVYRIQRMSSLVPYMRRVLACQDFMHASTEFSILQYFNSSIPPILDPPFRMPAAFRYPYVGSYRLPTTKLNELGVAHVVWCSTHIITRTGFLCGCNTATAPL